METPTKFTHGIFFDNQAWHLEEVGKLCKNIQLVEIAQSDAVAPNIAFDSPQFADFLKRVDPDATAAEYMVPNAEGTWKNLYLYWIIHANGVRSDAIDLLSGIQEHHMKIMDDWLEETRKYKDRVALFDWDRTITMVEGVRLGNRKDFSDEAWKYYVRHGISYLCGGEERVAFLRALFSKLVKEGVTIVVLTNNLACKTNEFRDFLTALIKDIPAFKICSIFPPYNGNKGIALQQKDQFLSICPQPLKSMKKTRRRSSKYTNRTRSRR